MTTRTLGRLAERKAERYLRQQGFRTVARNFQTKTGEIDLIVSQADLLVFVEVRMRSEFHHGSPAATVTRKKQLKIIRTAEWFLQSHQRSNWQRFRFDVIAISNSIDWIPGAFTLD